MDYFILSDIHGSLFDLKNVLSYLRDEKIIILGDILYHGPRNDLPDGYNPKEVVKILNDLKDRIIAINGNCDAEVDQMVLDFKLNKNFILEEYGKRIFLTHGHHLEEEKSKYFDLDMVFYGHTHVKRLTNDQYIFMNPGSISIPKDGVKSFAVLKNGNISLYDMSFRIIDSLDF